MNDPKYNTDIDKLILKLKKRNTLLSEELAKDLAKNRAIMARLKKDC